MNITAENNQVIVNLDEGEFPLFEAMFENLELDKFVLSEFRDFPWDGGEGCQKLLPMRLCRSAWPTQTASTDSLRRRKYSARSSDSG
ncbi:hypothetical protein KAH81_01270 [bacterium]|nr:hypothetical protein [bacterium]